MIFLYIRIRVRDYERWKVLFDEGEAARLKHGIELRKIFRSINEPNEISLLLEAAEIDEVNSFFNNQSSKKRMKKA